jgi:hypothetical protein
MPAKAGIQAGRLRGCLVDSRFRGNGEFATQLSSRAKPVSAGLSGACSSRRHGLSPFLQAGDLFAKSLAWRFGCGA